MPRATDECGIRTTRIKLLLAMDVHDQIANARTIYELILFPTGTGLVAVVGFFA